MSGEGRESWEPALGDWVVEATGHVGLVVGIGLHGQLALAPSPWGTIRAPGPWDRPHTDWLPGWAGQYGLTTSSEVRPATPNEISHGALSQLQAGGL